MSVVPPRFVHYGAGSTLQFPLDETTIPSSPSSPLKGSLQVAYFVAPASHIGRVVTGVILVAEPNRVNRMFAEDTDATDRFGLTTISFADKLAEQGYKVLVLDLFTEGKTTLTDSDTQHHVTILQQASHYLKQNYDIQRVGFFGVGAGADLAIKVAIERCASVDCVIAMCPKGLTWKSVESMASSQTPLIPMLLQVGEKSFFATSKAYQTLLSSCAANKQAAAAIKASLFVNQQSGFAFSNITDEDAATQAIAEILDWLVQHLHRFQAVAAINDTNPWWPQGRNGPFFNVGLRTWQESRATWLTPTQTRCCCSYVNLRIEASCFDCLMFVTTGVILPFSPPRPPPVPAHLLFDGLSSVRRTFDLPQRMRLGDVIELFTEIWDMQQ
ncbi:hypothetical protein PsorP6_002093 [Peronosclerospora sorghi]|uniref:Uncharacterized protein n=1 Tax=Peronosclerospora sorghi TaxID=230839 RepID=A0ACC0WQ12_9STRA|nr:hypothetical protein PsorP6_002093 [Peronosclerospora sorghi]